jgi:hypothetical protein
MDGQRLWKTSSSPSPYVLPPSLPHPSDPFMQLTCDGAYIIPRNVGNVTNFPYDTTLLPDSPSSHITRSVGLGPNQACTLFGARPGTSVVTGKDYIKAGYNLNTDDLWRRNVLVLFAFLLFFWFTQTVIIEVFPVNLVNSLFEIFQADRVRMSSNMTLAVVLASLRRIHPRQRNLTRS